MCNANTQTPTWARWVYLRNACQGVLQEAEESCGVDPFMAILVKEAM